MKFWNKYGKWFAVLLGLAVFFTVFEYVGFREAFVHSFQQNLKPWLEQNPVTAPFVFILVYIISVILMVPGTIMSVAGGVLFGPVWGTFYVSVGALTGAGLAFFVARYLAADWVEENIGDRLTAIKRGIERDGAEFVAITRLVPIFPFNLLNYAFGLTKINFWVHFWVSGVAMLPGTFAYVYAGYAGKKLFTGDLGLSEAIILGSSAIGILTILGMIPRWIQRFKELEIKYDTDQ